MIPVTGAGWSQVSGVGGVTEGASATATEDRIVVLRASADGAARAGCVPGPPHRPRERFRGGVVGRHGEHGATAAGEKPCHAVDDVTCSFEGLGEGGIHSAGSRLECTSEQ